MVNNKFVMEFINLDKQVKEMEKQRDEMKKSLTAFLQAREGKPFITSDCILQFQKQTRTLYNIPDEVKSEYAEKKEYSILKATLKK